MMDTKKLRQKVLDLAIRGKLVPQDPNDEPASVLLERIRKEKELLIKEGKIKRDKKENTCAKFPYEKSITNYELGIKNEEVPFQIPENWVWVKTKDIFEINPKSELDDAMSVAFIPMTLISDGFTNKHTSEIRKWGKIKKGFTHFREGDVGIAKITPCFENRKSIVFQNLENGYGAGTTELHILRPILEPFLSNFLIWFVKTEDFITNVINCFTGAVGQQRVGKNIIEETYFPLPPLSEQSRIVSAIESAFALIDEIETNKLSLSQFIKQTKSKVLDLAIRGKLVPQDPNDEPASVLLERIKNEQKTKKAAADISHYDDLLPNGWVICELGDLLRYEQPTKYIVNTTDYSDENRIPVLTAGKSFIIGYTNENFGVYEAIPVIIFDDFTTESKFVDFNFKVKSSAMKILSTNKEIADLKFLQYTMQTINFTHDTHKRYWISAYSKCSIALPPISEQHRIVQKIEEIFTQLDEIEKSVK